MGKTNKPASAAPRHKQAQTTGGPQQSTVDSFSEIIESACEQALRDVSSNPQKCLKRIEDLISKHPNSAAVHHTQSFVHFKLYSQTSSSSSTLTQKYLNNAVDSVKKAISLFPNSIALSYLHGLVFMNLAKDSSDYQRVINQCRKALNSLPSALGPGEDIIASQPEIGGESQESRIQRLKQGLSDVLEKAKVESLLVGKNVSEKMKESACLRIGVRVPKDEEKLPSESERNKKRASIKDQIQILWANEQALYAGFIREKDSESIMVKIMENLSKKTNVSNYWNEMSSEEKRGLLIVSIDEIAAYYKKHDRMVADFLLEAVDFARKTNKWKCLKYFSCEEVFFEWKELRSHVFLKHLGGLSEQQLELLPCGLGDWNFCCVEEIENGVWMPEDVDNMAQELSTSRHCRDDVYQEKCKIYSDQKKWMFCDDSELQKLLKKIHLLLKLFLKNHCLAPGILSWMWDYTIQELEESKVLGFKDLIPILEQTHPVYLLFTA